MVDGTVRFSYTFRMSAWALSIYIKFNTIVTSWVVVDQGHWNSPLKLLASAVFESRMRINGFKGRLEFLKFSFPALLKPNLECSISLYRAIRAKGLPAQRVTAIIEIA